MRTLYRCALGAFIILMMSPGANAAQFARERGGERVCFYQDIHFNGWEQCYSPGDEVANLQGRNNAISSIRVYGRVRVIVYSETNFRGASAEFNSDVPDLGLRSMSGSKSWSDRIQSVRISNGSGFGDRDRRPEPPPVFGRVPEPQEGMCIYERPNFQGRSQCWRSGEDIRDLGRSGGWSDKISSIRLFGRTAVILYRDIDFHGESVVIDRDVQDLGRLRLRGAGSWDNQVSSMQVQPERRRRGPAWYR